MTDDLNLFPDLPRLTPEPPLSADRRRTLRQRDDVANGRHPLTRGPISPDPDRLCGNCRFRDLVPYHRRTYPKCSESWPLHVAHSATSDVRAWWPGCQRHEYGDPKLSPDAARSGPQDRP